MKEGGRRKEEGGRKEGGRKEEGGRRKEERRRGGEEGVGEGSVGEKRGRREWVKQHLLVKANNWLETGQTKICLALPSPAEMTALLSAAKVMHVPTHVVQDAGKTQIAAGSKTLLVLGPAPVARVNKLTGHLKLYQ
jgi:peptidyl-tRNA hydrolase